MSQKRCSVLAVMAAIALAAVSLGQTTETPPPAAQGTEATTPPSAPPPAPPSAAAEFASPAATLRTFLTAMSEPVDLDRAAEALDLSQAGRDTGRDNAVKLYGVLNRIEEVDVDEHPSAADLAPGRHGGTKARRHEGTKCCGNAQSSLRAFVPTFQQLTNQMNDHLMRFLNLRAIGSL